MDDGDIKESIHDEVMVLESIFEEIEVTKCKSGFISQVGITVFPATANNTDEQHVKLQLQFNIPEQYPSVPVNVEFLTSRGLSDVHLAKLKELLHQHIEERPDEHILFSLIEIAKDCLTQNNVPASPCPICLFSFKKFDVFLKTDCFHHMHSHCMWQYIAHYVEQKKQEVNEAKRNVKHTQTNVQVNKVPCPVCRAMINFDFETLKSSPEPLNELEPIDRQKMKQKMESMNKIYEKQKLFGGLIDQEAEKNKHLLSSIEQAYAASLDSQNSGSQPRSSQLPSVPHQPQAHEAPSSSNSLRQEYKGPPTFSKEKLGRLKHHYPKNSTHQKRFFGKADSNTRSKNTFSPKTRQEDKAMDHNSPAPRDNSSKQSVNSHFRPVATKHGSYPRTHRKAFHSEVKPPPGFN